MNQQRVASSRVRLERLHGRGERAANTLEAVSLVVGGAVTLVRGLRTLLDIMSPPTKESDKD
jgi:hypothetical protein